MKDARNRPRGFRLADLAGSTPPDHQPLRRTVRGMNIIRQAQIWVDRETDELWSVRYAPHSSVHGKNRLIVLALYGFPTIKKTLTEATLEGTMEVLEAALARRKQRLADLRARYESGKMDTRTFPDFESFSRSFGIDPETGYRVG